MSEKELETDKIVEEAVPESEIAPTPADLPPDYGQPGAADFADPAWDDVEDEGGETPEPGEPDDEEDDDEEEDQADEEEINLEDEEAEGEPTVPPGIDEEEQELEPPDEPEDYDPEE